MTVPKTTLLFVDDDPSILAALRRRLRAHTEWDATFVDSATSALAALAVRTYDVVATDLHMPGMDGSALLAEVKRRWPAIFRVVLSGTCSSAAVLATVRDAHFFLSKPYELATLQVAVGQAVRHRRLVQCPALASFAAGLTNLPPLPATYQRISNAIADEALSLRHIGDLIADDVALTAKVLRLVNSGFCGAPKPVASIGEAATLLGTDILRSLVLGSSLWTSIDPSLVRESDLDRVWDHSLRVARGTQALGLRLAAPRCTIDSAYQAAVLHELGRLILLLNRPDAYLRYREDAKRGSVDSIALEHKHLGHDHAAVGSYVLALWGLPDEVCSAVARHRDPVVGKPTSVNALTLLYVADVLDAADTSANSKEERVSELGLLVPFPSLRDTFAQCLMST